MEISKNMTIQELLTINDVIAPFLMQQGMGCIFCPSSQSETLEEACMVHGMDADALIAALKEILAEYESAKE